MPIDLQCASLNPARLEVLSRDQCDQCDQRFGVVGFQHIVVEADQIGQDIVGTKVVLAADADQHDAVAELFANHSPEFPSAERWQRNIQQHHFWIEVQDGFHYLAPGVDTSYSVTFLA